MRDGSLLQTQQNALLVGIELAGFNPDSFSKPYPAVSRRVKDLMVTRIDHQRSAFFFLFDFMDGNLSQRFCVFSPGQSERESWAVVPTFTDQTKHFTRWLAYLKNELDAPDYWGAGSSGLFTAVRPRSDEENTDFTEEEKKQIAASLRSIKSGIEQLVALNQEQNRFVDERLDYLAKAASRVGRFDWKNLAVSTLLQIAIDLALDGSKATILWQAVSAAFQWLSGHPLLPGGL
jgi:hypothetical protein